MSITGLTLKLVILFIVIEVGSTAKLRRNQSRGQEQFKKHKKQLEELKKLAEDGGHSNPDSITKFDSSVCYTKDCIEAAKEFLISISFQEDPCKSGNWLSYSCVRRTMIGEGDDSDNDVGDMYQQSQVGYLGSVAIGQTLALLDAKNVSSPIMEKATLYYQQCEKWREEMNSEMQVDMIASYLKKFGDWPMLTGKDSPGKKFDWQKMVANNVRIAVAYGVAPYLFDIFIEEGEIPLMFTGELTLHKENSEIAEIIKILSKGKRDIKEDDKGIKEMRDFMASLKHPSEDKIDAYPLSNITKHHDFGNKFNLKSFYSHLLAGTKVKITEESEVAADVDWLVNHVKAVNEANPRIVSNILFLQTAAALLTRLTTLTHAEHFPTLEKYKSQGPLDCLRETYEKFDYAMSRDYINRYFDHNDTQTLVKLMDNMKHGYAETIESAKFLTSQTKVHAIDKANDVHTFIGTDAWVMDDNKIDEYYKNMNISEDFNFVQNHVAGLRFQWTKFLELSNANIFNYLVGDAYTGFVSAKYSYHFNQIRIQAALVQKPIFSNTYPGFMNYGGIGSVLSHTLGHSFDTNGVHFNKRGQRGDFWDDMSYEGYYNWTDSLIEDYNGDEYKKADPWDSNLFSSIDHSQAINDDIADIVGVKMAYKAYEKHLNDLKKDGKKEKILPGLKEFTPQQLFWMKYANTWCEHAEKSYLHALRDFNQHSPGNVRATFPLTRSKEWAKDFECTAPKKSEF